MIKQRRKSFSGKAFSDRRPMKWWNVSTRKRAGKGTKLCDELRKFLEGGGVQKSAATPTETGS
jgi:hypothetical protein